MRHRKRGLGALVALSSVFKRLKNRALYYLRNPDKLTELLRNAQRKAASIGQEGPLKERWDYLMAFFRLLSAYARREYQDIPLQHLILIVAAVLYFLLPTDLIPDFIFPLGLVDDAAIIAWVVNIVKADLDNFLKWESSRGKSSPEPT
jgi:uncharacterized membrane protein YkvA (DUF1232 family)